MEETVEEPNIFSGLSAWFSSSVSQHRKNVWTNNGGLITDFEEALFVFSEDFKAEDTKDLYQTKAYLSESLTVFHAMYIDDCLAAGQMKSVDIGLYMLPPEEVYKRLKEVLKKSNKCCCIYKWESVNCAACSLSFSTKQSTSSNTTINDQTSALQEVDTSGYVDVDTLEEPNYDEVEEFVVGLNGAEIYLKHP